MRRPPLYSRSSRPTDARSNAPDQAVGADTAADATAQPTRRSRLAHPGVLWAAIALLALMLGISISMSLKPQQRRITQDDIDAAVMKTMSTKTLPSQAARAYDIIRPSVVRVMGFGKDKDGKEEERGVGTGVVIVDNGTILTNLHVVAGAESLKVTFFDGLESTAYVMSTQPENDLAVLRANKLPDDLFAATMRSTQGLSPGEEVMAVGFPFGIGPSASTGIVSGLKRSFRSPEGKQMMSNLIQFDAAANPGNSGGPLVTMDGEVVGIVTAILNPNQQRTFVGIGFAVPIENAASAVGMPPF